MFLQQTHSINLHGHLMSFEKPVVMGILNVTPDSFYAESRCYNKASITQKVEKMVIEGAKIIDVGAYSTRPGASIVAEEEEIKRLRLALPIIRCKYPDIVISVDTFRPNVAKMVVQEYNVDIINDVAAGNIDGIFGGTQCQVAVNDDRSKEDISPMFLMIAHLNVPYVLMSSQPTIETILKEMSYQVRILHSLGVKDIIIDPGFGFGKSVEQNFHVLNHLDRLSILGLPILAGLSRKSMIFRTLGNTSSDALNGTSILNTVALLKGANILRVHDVRQAVEAITLTNALCADNSYKQ